MSRKALFVIAALFLVCSARDAHAQASCTISTQAVAFGNYNVYTTGADDANGRVTFRCNAAAANITVALSTGSSGSYNPRTMRKAGEPLAYNLYRNAARTNIWGNGSGGTQIYSNANPPNNSNVNVTVYGRIPGGQDVSAGAYSDTVVATINF